MDIYNDPVCANYPEAFVIPEATGEPTPTPTMTASLVATLPSSQLSSCQIQYLAHMSTGEATASSSAALAGVMLSQINYYSNAGGRFYGFRNAVEYLNANTIAVPPVTPIADNAQDQRRYAYVNYIHECELGRLPAPTFAGSQWVLAVERWQLAQEMAVVMTNDMNQPLSLFDNLRYGVNQADSDKLELISVTTAMAYEKGISDMRRFIMEYANYPQMIPWWGTPVEYNVVAERVIFWPVLSEEHQGVLVHSGAAAGLPAAYYCPQPPSGPPAIQIGLEPNNLFCAVCDSTESMTWASGEQFPRSCEVNGNRVGFDLNRNPY